MQKFVEIRFKDLIIRLVWGILIALIVTIVISVFNSSKPYSDDKEYQGIINKNYMIFTPVIPQNLSFAGEKVPLEKFDVRESLDKELLKTMYWHSETFLYFKRANRFFPVIEPILKKNNVPDDFKYLAIAESGLENVVSPSKAAGYWQFLAATGREFNLEINDEVDERYHIEKSTQAACDFLNKMFVKYKNWALVAAAYNMGQNALDSQIEWQKSKDYYDLLLNSETARYLYRIIAYKLIFAEPANYGFRYRKKDLYPIIYTNKVKVDSTITDFVKFAETYNTNYKILKFLNPWLRDRKLTNKTQKVYYIDVPKENARTYDYIKELSAADDSVYMQSMDTIKKTKKNKDEHNK